MDYFLDTEFCQISKTLITLAIIREDNVAMYVGVKGALGKVEDQWVKDNVIPYIDKAPIPCRWHSVEEIQQMLEKFFAGDECPTIIVDWPSDINYFSDLIITGPGKMINVKGMTFELKRVESYPTEVTPAFQHVAYWDAMALKQKVQFPNGMKLNELHDIQKEFLRYNPVTGDEFHQDVLDGFKMRLQFPEVPWYFNPWTGKHRTPEAAQADPYGAKIKHGD